MEYTDITTIILLGSISGLLLRIIIKTEILRRRAIAAMPDDELSDEVQDEDYNGKNLQIREEERAVWDKLSRGQKRWVMKEQERKVKSGQYFKTEDGKLITRAEAKKHGLI